jgi:pyruvate carboxylase
MSVLIGYVGIVRELQQAGVQVLGIKDMAGPRHWRVARTVPASVGAVAP